MCKLGSKTDRQTETKGGRKMVLKLRTMDDGWVYYPIKRKVKIRGLARKQYEFGMEMKAPDRVEIALDYLNDPKRTDIHKAYRSELKVINFEDVERTNGESVIYTNLAVYLLNDEGKTIEKLN